MQICARAVLMTPPADFGFNDQTDHDNAFQARPEAGQQTVRARAMGEFTAMVDRLRDEGVDVVILPAPQRPAGATPDAVFLNNWLRLDRRGTLWTFGMATANRRRERRPRAAERALRRAGYLVRSSVHLWPWGARQQVVEGTGAMLFDPPRRRIYAALSRRCHPRALARYAAACGHQVTAFDTRGPDGQPIYHTNVMLALGDKVAVLCGEAIADAATRRRVEAELRQHHHLIAISMQQMGEFCGNMLQLEDVMGRPLFVMSQRAHTALGEALRRELATFGPPGRHRPRDLGVGRRRQRPLHAGGRFSCHAAPRQTAASENVPLGGGRSGQKASAGGIDARRGPASAAEGAMKIVRRVWSERLIGLWSLAAG